nr:wall-associated receptor kinase-like 14 [Ipomoea batatas]
MLLLLQSAMVFGSSTCNRSCGDGLKQVPFPFGFSSGCEIPLNCTSGNGTMSIGEFPVYQLTSGTIMINIPVKCGRRIEAMKPLFGKNFAPTVNNGILLQNCSSPELKCMIPSTMIQTQFELQECGKDNISCFSDPQKIGGFIGYGNLTGTGCKSLFSAISSVAAAANTTAVSLDIQVLELGWWLRGHCRCSKNANCTEIRPPGDGKPGFRCRCFEGFTGDGYLGGSGCRRDDTRCSPAKYLLGQCGGKTRIGVLIGGVIAGAALMISVGLICCIIRRRLAMNNSNRKRRELRETTGITIPVYSYKDIEKATNNFSDKRRLGDGAYGTVYSGKLHDDEWDSPSSSLGKQSKSHVRLRKQTPLLRYELKLNSWPRNGAIVCLSNSSSSEKLSSSETGNRSVSANGISGLEPFQGKTGCVSFAGLTHQLVEERKLESAPSGEEAQSFMWVVAPVALISSFLLPPFLVYIAVDGIKNEVFSDVMFYIGLGVFLSVTDQVQKPYLEFSAKRWGLITGLPGYLPSAFVVMGIKIALPLIALLVTWPVLGTTALVGITPFLVGCLVQYAFERYLGQHKSSCWPLVPIIFEVYRLYQLSRAMSFAQDLVLATRTIPNVTDEFIQRTAALFSQIMSFQVLGVVCLWSLLTFLQRLFPSRPVAENY